MLTLNKYVIIAIIFFIHLLFINFPTVNFEYVFFEAASQFENNKILALNNYFKIQANTFLFPFLIFITNYFLSIDFLTLSRVLSILCVIPLGLSIIKFSDIFFKNDSIYLLSLILCNPFIFVMAHRGTPDFISASIAVSTFPYLISFKKNIHLFVFSIILGFAIALKPTVGIILILINLYFLFKLKFNFLSTIKETLIINFFSLLPFLFYILYVNLNFNFLLANEYYTNSLKINSIRNYFSNFILYIGYIYLFIFSLRISVLYHKILFLKFNYIYILFTLIILFFAFLFPIPQLELNLSFLSKILGKKIENFIFVISFLIFIFDIYLNRQVLFSDIIKKTIFISIILFFLIMSFFSPSQRYLICIIPLFIYLFFVFNKKYFVITIFIYIFFNLLLSINQYLNGYLSKLIVIEMKEKNILDLSCPGVIEAHIGNSFPIDNKNCNEKYDYTVVYGNSINSIKTIKISLFFISKTLSIVKL